MIENTESEIRAVCNEIAEMLVEKNRSYGDSALNPLRCFSKEASGIEQLNVRMDDKLSRLLRGNGNHFNEDVEKDLMGYLVLKRVAVRRMEVNKATALAAEEDPAPSPVPEPPPRFVKPTATTARELLAKEQDARTRDQQIGARSTQPGPGRE